MRKVAYFVAQCLPASRDYWVIAGRFDSIPYMPICASCLATTELGRCEGNGVLIPYCSACLSSIGRTGVGNLAWILAEVLSSMTACAFLAMLPWVSEGAAIGFALAFTVVPWLAGQTWKNYSERLPSRHGKAVFVIAEGLACRNAEWAAQLCNRMGAHVHSKCLRIGAKLGWASSRVLIALLATLWLFVTFHPTVRILNLTDDVIVTFADEHKLAIVQLTSSENPSAGSLTRVPLGKRLLSARRLDGTIVDQALADVIAGHAHLFAPSRPRNICFWVERTGIGRAHDGLARREVLAPLANFWSIKSDIDVWFEPALGSSSTHFTGSVVTALRQGACPSAAGTNAD